MRSLVEYILADGGLSSPLFVRLGTLLRCREAESDVARLVGAWHAQTACKYDRHVPSGKGRWQTNFGLRSLRPSTCVPETHFDSIYCISTKLT
jgi:hypothetical protein